MIIYLGIKLQLNTMADQELISLRTTYIASIDSQASHEDKVLMRTAYFDFFRRYPPLAIPERDYWHEQIQYSEGNNQRIAKIGCIMLEIICGDLDNSPIINDLSIGNVPPLGDRSGFQQVGDFINDVWADYPGRVIVAGLVCAGITASVICSIVTLVKR